MIVDAGSYSANRSRYACTDCHLHFDSVKVAKDHLCERNWPMWVPDPGPTDQELSDFLRFLTQVEEETDA